MQEGREALRAGVVAALVAAAVGSCMAVLGVVNGDEAWYTLAARAMANGKVPYRDFAFPQAPFYPMVLAPIAAVVPGLLTSRLVSVALLAAGVGFLVALARTVGGRSAAWGSAAALLATAPSLPYWLSITKTYALLAFLLAVLAWTLGTQRTSSWWSGAVGLSSVLLTATRTTAITIAVPVLFVAWRTTRDRERRQLVIWTAAASAPFAVLVLLSWPQARWNLLEYHSLTLKPDHGFDRFVERTLGVVAAWPGPFTLSVLAVVCTVAHPLGRAWWRRNTMCVALALGVAIFVVAHESAQIFFTEEYFAPVAPIVVVGSVLVLHRHIRACQQASATRLRTVVRLLLVGGIVVTATTGGHSDYFGLPGWAGSIAATDRVADCVARHTRPSDYVFAMYFSDVVLEADRRPVPGTSIGAFSYQDLPDAQARSLRMLNKTGVVAALRHYRPRVLVLSDFDFDALRRAGFFSRHWIDQTALFGQFAAYRPLTVCDATVERNVFTNLPLKVKVYERIIPPAPTR